MPSLTIVILSQTLRKMLGPLPREWWDKFLSEAGGRIQMLVAFKTRANHHVMHDGQVMQRPLRATLRVAFGEVDGK